VSISTSLSKKDSDSVDQYFIIKKRFRQCRSFIIIKDSNSVGGIRLQLPTSHSQRLNSEKPLGYCEWLWSIATCLPDSGCVPFLA